MRPEHIAQERLIEPDRAERATTVSHQELENLEARSAGGSHAAANDLADNGRLNAGAQRRNRPEIAAILVANRETIKEIFDGVEADALQIRGAPRPDSLQILEWG